MLKNSLNISCSLLFGAEPISIETLHKKWNVCFARLCGSLRVHVFIFCVFSLGFCSCVTHCVDRAYSVSCLSGLSVFEAVICFYVRFYCLLVNVESLSRASPAELG